MCELLALSSSRPSHLTYSFQALSSHAKASARDGWGVAFYQGHDVALFREPLAASDSALVDFLQTHRPSTTMAVSHIRHATVGAIELPNTQPFARELAGRMHVFAHNGTLPGIQEAEQFRLGRYKPVGSTDSEYAFCVLLDRLCCLWEAHAPPTLEARLTLINAFASELRLLGPANFLYADSDILFAHGDRRIQASDGSTRAPGLLLLERRCQDPKNSLTASSLSMTTGFQDSVLVASVALTEGPWRAFTEGELVAISMGKVLGSMNTLAKPTRVIA